MASITGGKMNEACSSVSPEDNPCQAALPGSPGPFVVVYAVPRLHRKTKKIERKRKRKRKRRRTATSWKAWQLVEISKEKKNHTHITHPASQQALYSQEGSFAKPEAAASEIGWFKGKPCSWKQLSSGGKRKKNTDENNIFWKMKPASQLSSGYSCQS